MASVGAAAHDLRDIKGLRPPPPPTWPTLVAWGAAFAIAAVLALLAWRLWSARRRAQRRQGADLTPEQRAMQDLAALYGSNMADAAAVRQYFFAISEVLRTWVTRRFALNAAQLTTQEIFDRLPDLVGLPPAESVRLRRFLAATDPVKYANHRPSTADIDAAYADAVEFVRATAPAAAPAGTGTAP